MAEDVTSAEVAPYSDLVSDLTRKFIGRFGAEYDDLFQEGMESVFMALRKGEQPSKVRITQDMRDYVRMLEYQTRYTRLRESSYEEHLAQLLEQEEQESQSETKRYGGLDYIDASEVYS